MAEQVPPCMRSLAPPVVLEDDEAAQLRAKALPVADWVRNVRRPENNQLFLSVQRGNLAEARRLLEEQGADVNVEFDWEDGCTPLHHAVRNLDNRMAEMLLQHGADPNVPDRQMQFTPIFHCARAGRATASSKDQKAALAMARLLFRNGAKPRVVHAEGDGAAGGAAADFGLDDESSAPVGDVEDVFDRDGNNVMFWARELGNKEFMQLPNLEGIEPVTLDAAARWERKQEAGIAYKFEAPAGEGGEKKKGGKKKKK